MNKIFPLTDLKIGETATVKALYANDTIKRRLLDIGVIEGTRIECIMKSPWNDPTAYQIRGAIIALRCEDSKNIIMTI